LTGPAPLLPADPRANYLAHRRAIDDAIRRVLESGWYILGNEVKEFEAEFSRYIGPRFTVGVGSGTDALLLALRVLGIGPGDAVVTVSNTAVATVAAIDLVGATPVLSDVDPETFTLDPERLEQTIAHHSGPRLRAIIPVHLYGHPADMEAIRLIAERHGLDVIEDCAQSHGATIAGRMTGTWGRVSAFSFYPTKNLGALGDGGALVTDDPHLAEQARAIRQYGWRDRYVSEQAGTNTRLDELQAAILRAKLPALDAENRRRREIAGLYDAALAGSRVTTPRCRKDVQHVFHQYTIRTGDRDDLRERLRIQGVGTAVLYPVPIHQQPGYRDRVIVGRSGLGRTEQLNREILSLPMYPELGDDQARRIGDLVADWSRAEA
jgi:dTDP-4-amino-4,6-dideoxygalactose transaminase